MNLYDFCRAVARYADRYVGLSVCKEIVEKHAAELDRVSSEQEFRAAYQATLRTFSPHDEVGLIAVPFKGRAMGRFLVEVISCGHVPSQETWRHNQTLQNHLAAAVRHLVVNLCSVPTPKKKRPAARASQQRTRDFLTREEKDCLWWGHLMSHAAYVMSLAEKLSPLRTIDRQTVLEAVRDGIAGVPEITLEHFANRIKTYADVPAAKA